MPQTHQKFIQNSSISNILIFLLAFFTILPQNSTQQAVVTGTCTYSYDTTTGYYMCRLGSGLIANPTDVLNITGNHLQDRTDSDVKYVWYPANNMHYLTRHILEKFKNLTIFKLDCITLREINQDAFDVFPNLEQFTSSLSNLTTYPAQMMKNCVKLKVFKSTLQQFTEIPDIFGNITSLEEVNLSGNRLVTLSDKLVQNKPNLRIFNALDNKLTELPVDFFFNCSALQEVDVSDNQFEDQYKVTRAFNGNTNIKVLGLYDNKFTNFDFTFFAQFFMLEKLTIGSFDKYKLTQISWLSLPNTLTVLTVRGVGEEIPENAFSHLIKLSSLQLSGAGITSLHKDTFKSQTELKMLSIDETNLKTLPSELFASQSNLINLALRFNQIEELPVGVFASLVSLGMASTSLTLDLSNNKIKRLNASSFGQHPHLQTISFASNQIEAIQRGIFSKFNSTLYQANFDQNVCVSKLFSNVRNLDEDESLKWCFDSWDGITTTTTTTTTTSTTLAPSPTTPGAAGSNFKKFEVFVIILMSFVGVLINFGK